MRWLDIQLCRAKHFAQNLQIHNLLRQEVQGVRIGVACVIPKPVAIQPVLEFASRTVIQWCADSIKQSTVGFGIESHPNLLLLVDGFNKTCVVRYHSVDVLTVRFDRPTA